MPQFSSPGEINRRRTYPLVRYRIDGEDRLIFCNPAFDAFARENDAPLLHGEALVGRSLWEFIGDSDVRELNVLLVQKARQTHKVVSIPFRCDNTEIIRYMELDILPLDHGTVEFQARLVRQHLRPAPHGDERLDPDAPPRLAVCSWCKRIEVAPGDWRDLEQAAAKLPHLHQDHPRLNHGACPDCAQKIGLLIA